MHTLLNAYDDNVYGVYIVAEDNTFPLLPDNTNWSTVDLDAPYTRCTICCIEIDFPSEICSQCTQIQAVLSSIHSDLDDQ